MVELAAAYAKISVSDAISMLTAKGLLSQEQEGFSEGISNYFINNINRRESINSLWERCKENSRNLTPSHLELLARLDIQVGPNWDKVGSNLIGFNTKKDMSDSLNAGWKSPQVIFTGRGWRDVCVIPAYSSPNKISAFLMIGRNCETHDDFLVKRISYKSRGCLDNEYGMLFLNDAIQSKSQSVVITDDAINSVKMVLDYAGKHSCAPPVCVLLDHFEKRRSIRTSESWRSLHQEGKEVVASGSAADKLCPTSSLIKKSNYLYDWKESWVGSAKWVNLSISSKEDEKVTKLTTTKNKEVVHAGIKYEQRQDGIYVRNRLVSDIVLKIEKVVSKDYTVHYSGVMQKEGKEIQFVDWASNMEQKYLIWSRRMCLKNKLKSPYCYRRYAPVAIAVSMLFNPPKITEVSESVAAFKMGKFVILENGEVEKDISSAVYDTVSNDEPLDFFEKQEMGNKDSGLAWAAIICCMANVLAKKNRYYTLGIGVANECFSDFVSISEKIGCTINKSRHPGNGKSIIGSMLLEEERSSWPVVIAPLDAGCPARRVMIEAVSGARNCAVAMDRLTLLGCRTISRWVYINSKHIILSESVLSSLSKIPLNFLSWVIKENKTPDGLDYISKITKYLKEWCEYNNIGIEGLYEGASIIDSDLHLGINRSTSESFKQMCSKFACMGLFSGDVSIKSTNNKNSVWLQCREFFLLCKDYNIPVAEPGKLAQSLLATGCIEDYTVDYRNRQPSFVIDPIKWEEWCAKI